MNTVLQYKYITLLGPSLDGFKQVGRNLWNFRCPLCGDSAKNKNKKRGYIYLKEDNYRFHCHNCGADQAFKYFLQNVSSSLYKDYQQEAIFSTLKNAKHSTEEIKPIQLKQSKKLVHKSSDLLIPVSSLANTHPAIEYVQTRRIPESEWNRIYWVEHFKEVLRQQFGAKYEERIMPDQGLVFTVRTGNSKDHPIVGYQLRSIERNVPKKNRFVTCIENNECGLFGLDTLDTSKKVYVTEGAIDSLFVPNCLAVLTSSLYRVPKEFYEATFINDCEPRNPQIVKQIEKCISLGLKVVLLPSQYDSLDINDLVCHYNLSQKELVELLDQYTFKGIEAKLKFAKWRLW